MKSIISTTFFLLSIFSAFGMQLQQSQNVTKDISDLGKRYSELGRFSGSILVEEDGEIIYHNFFGKADYGSKEPFLKNTVFSLGTFTNLILNDTNEQQDTEVDSASMEKVAQKGIVTLIEILNLQNTFLQTEAPANAATGYVHTPGPNGVKTTPVPQEKELQLWTNATDLQKLIATVAVKDLVQDGYSEKGGFSYAIKKIGDRTVIVLSNRRHPVAAEMAEGINAILEGNEYRLPLARKEVKVEPALLTEYAGSYRMNPNMQIKIEASNDSLFVHMGPQKVHLKPQSFNQFFMEEGDSAIRFIRDNNGKVTSAELLDGFLSGTRIEKVN